MTFKTIIESYITGEDATSFIGSPNVWLAQSFTIGNTGTNEDFNLKKIKLKARALNSPGILNFSIRKANSAQIPIGEDLSTGTFDGDTLPSTPTLEIEVDMTPVTLNASSRYAIIIKESSTGSFPGNTTHFGKDDNDATYTGGKAWESNSAGGSWNELTGDDFLFEILSDSSPVAGKNQFYVDNNGVWTLFDSSSFNIKKKSNQISEFEVKVFDVTTAQKAYFKEFTDVLFFSGTTMILKGRIQTIQYGTGFEVIARGFGSGEATLMDSQFIVSGDNRIQYTNGVPSDIALNINNDNSLITGSDRGLYDPDINGEENISMRFEYANRLKSAVELANAIDYDWWISQKDDDYYITDYLNIDNRASSPGTETHFIETTDSQDIHGTGGGIDGPFSVGVERWLNGRIEKLAFRLKKVGTPTGTASISIREEGPINVLGDIIVQKEFDVSTLPTTSDWHEVTFDTPTSINQRVWMMAEYSGGDASNKMVMEERFSAYDPNFPSEQFSFFERATDGNLYFNQASGPTNYRMDILTQKTFSPTTNAIFTNQEIDVTSLNNFINVLGYGDGVNQLKTTTFAASTQSSILNKNITSTDSSIELVSATDFDATGTARIAEEQLTYAGVSTNTLTGCTRGTNSTTALAHNRNCYTEQYFASTNSQTGSSIQVNGLLDEVLVDRTLLDLPTAEVIASKRLLERKDPIKRITIIPQEPFDDVALLEVGDYVSITDSESNINGDFNIVGINYRDYYGSLELGLEVSNRNLEFTEQLRKQREEEQNLGKYMQGSTNIYAINEAENTDNTNPLNLRFFIPSDAVAINKVTLNLSTERFRSYTKTSESNSETSAVDVTANSFSAISVTTSWTTLVTQETSAVDRMGEFVQFGVGTNIGTDGMFFRVYDGTNYYPNSTGIRNATNDTANGDWISPLIFIPKNVKSKTLTLQAKKGINTSNFTGYSNYWGIARHTHGMDYGIQEDTFPTGTVKIDVEAGADGAESTVTSSPFTVTDGGNLEVDITTEISGAGAGNWANIKITPVSLAWDIATAIYLQEFDYTPGGTPTGVFFKPDGLKMYVVNAFSEVIEEFDLTIAWDVSTAVYLQEISVALKESFPTGVFFKPDGLKMYVVGLIGKSLDEWNLSTAWNVTTAVYSQELDLSLKEDNPRGVFFKPDGSKLYIAGAVGKSIDEWNLSTAWNVTTAVYSQELDYTKDDLITDLFFKSDGLKMYTLGSTTGTVEEWNLSTAWDVTSAVFLQEISIAGKESQATGLFFKPDGSKIYTIGANGLSVDEYDLADNRLRIEAAAFIKLFIESK